MALHVANIAHSFEVMEDGGEQKGGTAIKEEDKQSKDDLGSSKFKPGTKDLNRQTMSNLGSKFGKSQLVADHDNGSVLDSVLGDKDHSLLLKAVIQKVEYNEMKLNDIDSKFSKQMISQTSM